MIKYYIHKLIGDLLKTPIIPNGRTVGYSVVHSELCISTISECAKVIPPYYLHNVIIGDYSYLARNVSATNVTIGRFCSIGPNFCCGLGLHPTNGVSTSPMFYSTARQNGVSLVDTDHYEESRHTQIGNDVFIGANVTVLDGVTIGDGAVIGAGAVVTRDIPPYAVAVGVPAKVVKYRFDEATIAKLQEKQWWNGDEEELEKVAQCEFDVQKYLEQ